MHPVLVPVDFNYELFLQLFGHRLDFQCFLLLEGVKLLTLVSLELLQPLDSLSLKLFEFPCLFALFNSSSSWSISFGWWSDIICILLHRDTTVSINLGIDKPIILREDDLDEAL